MRKFTVGYDACVLYPAPLRDTLMHLALTDLFKAYWTDRIHEEWMDALVRIGKHKREVLELDLPHYSRHFWAMKSP